MNKDVEARFERIEKNLDRATAHLVEMDLRLDRMEADHDAWDAAARQRFKQIDAALLELIKNIDRMLKRRENGDGV